jgi:hypothetical protein
MTRNALPVADGLNDRAYGREILLAVGLYGVLLLGSGAAIDAVGEDSPARFALALLPMLGFLAGIRAVARVMRRLDERERELLLQTLAVSFGATAAITFSYGFLEAAGAPKISMFAVWPLQAALWIVSGAIVRARA